MADITMRNESLEIGIDLLGAELKSLRRIDTDTEYLWGADPEYWGRTSPILFPFVGRVKNGIYRHEGKEYRIGQHGFARDREFTLLSQTADTVWFVLEDDEASRQVYPFAFRLEIGYQLLEDGVKVIWKVSNPAENVLYFSIGGHPGFNCPLHQGEKQTEYQILLQDKEGGRLNEFVNTMIGPAGTVIGNCETEKLENGIMPITENLFDHDAKVLENGQAQRVALLDGSGQEYLAMEFDAPIVGIWSPAKKQAPFVCIEPWYGRCDSEAFDGELKDREWERELQPGEEFRAEYKIVV